MLFYRCKDNGLSVVRIGKRRASAFCSLFSPLLRRLSADWGTAFPSFPTSSAVSAGCPVVLRAFRHPVPFPLRGLEYPFQYLADVSRTAHGIEMDGRYTRRLQLFGLSDAPFNAHLLGLFVGTATRQLLGERFRHIDVERPREHFEVFQRRDGFQSAPRSRRNGRCRRRAA